MKTTIGDVAREAGVSIATVSRVLNNNYPVHKDTRTRVEQAIQKLRFTPNALARGLISKQTNTIGVLVPSITNMFFTTVVSGLQDYLRENGFHILLCDTGGQAESELSHIRSLQEKLVDGIISIDPRTANLQSGAYERIGQETPLVLVNGYHAGINLNFVMNDQESGSREALQYLVGLGHRNIAFLRGRHSYSYDIKEDVYRRVLGGHQIPIKEDNIISIEQGNSIETIDLAREAFASYLRQYKGKAECCTAVFCCNDWMATGALYAAQTNGKVVPQDLSIIGYDNIIIAEMTMPKLTTVDQNMRRLGRVAAEQLYRLMREPDPDTGYMKIILDTRLVARDSCGYCASK